MEKGTNMDSLRQAAVTLALMGAVLPLRADSSSPGKGPAANLANIRAQFAAKDATIADLQRQVTAQAARIADLQKQPVSPAAAAPPAATLPAPDKAARLSLNLPAMPVTAALASLSRKAGVPILTDDTVEGMLGAMSVNQPGLEPALDQLKTAVPGLAWQKVYPAERRAFAERKRTVSAGARLECLGSGFPGYSRCGHAEPGVAFPEEIRSGGLSPDRRNAGCLSGDQ